MPSDPYAGKLTTAKEAMSRIRSGMHVLIGSGAAEPRHLVDALAARGPMLADTEIIHLLTLGTAPYVLPGLEGSFRHNALFIGPNVRAAVQRGAADYTPCLLSEVPSLIRQGRLPVDAVLLETTPPEGGVCSLGVSVDILKAAVEKAELVVAQINPEMPWTLGDCFVRVEDIDFFVEKAEPLPELFRTEPSAAALWIGNYVSRLVRDGDTLQLGIGAIPDAILRALGDKKDLGVHSEMISDGVLDLWRRGVITGRRKTLHPGKAVASFCLGSRELYQAIGRNPAFEFFPSDRVNSPLVIAQNDNLVAINSALQVDLTGQVAADSIGGLFYSGVGGQADFIRGASLSKGGRSIIALPSTAKDGGFSRLAAVLSEGAGVVTTRADVDFVVTEYGIASLKGKTIRERAVALIQIAHPSFRKALAAAAQERGFLDAGHVLPALGRYRADLEARVKFEELEVFFRPVKPDDERYLKDLFYSQSGETTYRRFGMALKRLSERQFQELVAIDYHKSMAIAGFINEGARGRLIAVGRWFADQEEGPAPPWIYGAAAPLRPPSASALAEVAFTVHDDYQGRGIGTFLLDYLSWIAKDSGLEGFRAEVVNFHPRMVEVLERCYRRTERRDLGLDGVGVTVRFKDWRGKENPAFQPQGRSSLAG